MPAIMPVPNGHVPPGQLQPRVDGDLSQDGAVRDVTTEGLEPPRIAVEETGAGFA